MNPMLLKLLEGVASTYTCTHCGWAWSNGYEPDDKNEPVCMRCLEETSLDVDPGCYGDYWWKD